MVRYGLAYLALLAALAAGTLATPVDFADNVVQRQAEELKQAPKYICKVYIGSERRNQCQCEPKNCGAGCVPTVLFKNTHGCDSKCNGCRPP